MKRDLAGVGGKLRMRAMGGGLETAGGDRNKTGLVVEKKGKKSTTGIGASFTQDYRDKEESKNIA